VGKVRLSRSDTESFCLESESQGCDNLSVLVALFVTVIATHIQQLTRKTMLYKGHSIEIWKSEWIDKRIDGVWYSLHSYCYLDRRWPTKDCKYIAIVDEINPQRTCEIWGGSSPAIALDLARFSIDLKLSNRQRWDVAEEEKKWKAYNLKRNSKAL